MGARSFSKLLSNAILCITLLIGFGAKAQNPNTFSVPGYSMNYNHNGTNWVHQSNSTFTYNAQGKPIEELQQDPTTNQNKVRITYTYDTNGNNRTTYSYQWQNSAWMLAYGYRDSIVYTPANKIASIIERMYRPTTGWENNMRIDFIYDINNNQLEQSWTNWDRTLAVWQPFSKETRTYNTSGIITQKQYLNYLNGAWTILYTENNITWHVPNVIAATYSLDDPRLNYPERVSITMGANGGTVKLTEYYFTPSSQWRNSTKETITYDNNGNLTRRYYETFNNNGVWEITSDNQQILTYNNLFDITERVTRGANYGSLPGNGFPPYLNKYVYSNFQYFPRLLGTTKENLTVLRATIYPNPTQDLITIQLPSNKALKLTATISDISGKKWFSKPFNSGELLQINVETLPKGIYLIQLETEKGKTLQKIIKN
jgi:hypothetical protein